MEENNIKILGARVHNLQNVDLEIPCGKLVVITGLSGSGKSSLAFDTIYAEGQRRYMETLSTYARQFVGTMERPDVDKITGLSPVVAIEQKTTNKNPRSTVGTVTEINDFLRLLYARASRAYSPVTGGERENFGWCFDCVPEENSLYFEVNGVRFELPSVDLVLLKSKELLGEPVEARFGKDFPIRFDFLDTMGGGNLSLQGSC